MAAKLLQSLTEENPDLSKQIGCMTGIFQLFDRQHLATGRRITGHPRRLPPGDSDYNCSTTGTDINNRYYRRPAVENQSNKSNLEEQRLSTETSRPSFSSSSHSSSFSSLDFNRTAQPEPLSFDHMIFSEVPSRRQPIRQSSASPHSEHQSQNLRDVVRDSMYRELRELSVKTIKKEATYDSSVKRRDSPRPPHLSKINDGSYRHGRDERHNMPVDLEESLKVFSEVQEARPWYLDEPSKLSRSSSYQLRDRSPYLTPKDAPRYSYDERERSHLSYDSQDSMNQTLKLKELPRLSLDSRESSMRSFNSDTQSSFMSKSMQESGNYTDQVLPGQHQIFESQQRPPSVVAKLMGLESLPNSASNIENKIRTNTVKESEASSSSSKATDAYRSIQPFEFSRNSWKEPTSPRWRNPDPVMKPISRVSIEPAPWRLHDGTRGSRKVVPRNMKAPEKAPSPFPSVYSEIENRLKDLEFRQSGKDLRALKQILQAMQVKGLVDNSKGGYQDHEQMYTGPNQNTREMNQKQKQNKQNDHVSIHTSQRSISSRTSESPIVIMKPAKLVEKSGTRVSSVVPPDRLPIRSRRQGSDYSDKKTGSNTSRMANDQISKTSRRDHTETSTDMKGNVRISKSQISTRHQQVPAESTTSYVKSSGSISPRLQQKKLEMEKRSRPPISPSDSSKLKKQQSNKQQPESSSPGGRLRAKSLILQQSDGNQSPLMQTSKYSKSLVAKRSSVMRTEDDSVEELGTTSPEYPSPVSVLDGAEYIDNEPSRLSQILETIKDNSSLKLSDNVTKEQWHSVDSNEPSTWESSLTPQVNRKKLQSIDHLVQKLRRLNSGHDEARTDYIASLCENTNPDDRYISEIFLASGLLLRDLGSNVTTFQFHQSGQPINPELFLVLEQTKASTRLKEGCRAEKVVQLKTDNEKNHRKLIFDAVNEVLTRKLTFIRQSKEPWLRHPAVTRKTLNAQKLLRESCFEIEQLQAKKPACSLEDEDDGLKSILWEDVLHPSESFTDFQGEISGLVLDIERSLFKDLVGEIVTVEAANLRVKTSGKLCRQLFVN
ncbi:Protein LONGIFOLIA like [Heracleum sosnowskyi]|uniref:Protein LONGIFOLIA like n=1 Tax=Heracleum sosnowskyi TaxID=360622 RepID=A0AAD8JMB2_9APIA|nr:Protein LONGIFOLIA like [Heracleum sosnowskyi]